MPSLQQLLKNAKSGRVENVEPLCHALPEVEFIIPGIPQEGAVEGSGPDLIPDFQELGQSPSSQEFQPYVLRDEQDRPFLPVCSGHEGISELPGAGRDGSLTGMEMDGARTFSIAQDLYERGEVEGMVIDLFQDTELRLNPDEIESLCDGSPVPLKDHLRGKEVEDGDIEEFEPPEDLRLPKRFLEIIRSYVDADDALSGFECVWGVNPAVDRRKHVILNLLSARDAEIDEQERAQEIYQAVSDYLPSPGFIEVVFDRSFDRPMVRGN